MKNNFTITVKIWDYWIIDTYELGKNNVLYVLIEIQNKLWLQKIILKDND